MVDELKSTSPKPFVFVLMPFKPEFNDIYTFGIKGAAEEAGVYAERIDEQIFAEISWGVSTTKLTRLMC